MVIQSAAAQPFSRQQLHRMGMETVKNMVRKDPDKLMGLTAADLSRYPNPEATPSAPSVGLRDEADRDISVTDEEAESEIHAAVNPADTNNIIVASMKFSEGGLLGAELTFPIYYTRDFGRSWQLSEFTGVPSGGLSLLAGGGDPIVVFDSKGTAYFSWLTLTIDLTLSIKVTLNWAISRDGGATWEKQPDPIDTGHLSDLLNPTEGRFVDKQWMAVDRSNSPYHDNIYIAYAEINLQDSTYQILFKRKEAGKNTLDEKPVVLTTPDIVFAQFTSIDVDSRGDIHVLFAGATEADEVASFFHVRSTDGGATFSAPVRISPFSLPCFPPDPESTEPCSLTGIDPNRVYPCPHLRVDQSGGPHDGTLYAVWTADGVSGPETAGVDIYYSRSTDGGDSWSQARVLNDNTDPASHQFFPSLAVNQHGTVVVTWYDRREDPENINTKYYLATSEDGGLTFSPNRAVSSQASDFSVIGSANGNFGVGEYTQVVTTGSYAMPFWADGRSNDGNVEVFTTQILLGGEVTTDVPVLSTVTDKFTIEGPFPNPVRDVARFRLILKEASPVAVSLFSLDGKLVQPPSTANLPAGEHQFDVPTANLATGQYLAVVVTDFGIRTAALSVGH